MSIPPINRSVAMFVVGGTILRLWLIWSGWCDRYVIADDAYYYFTIARNIAAGLGSTFDGLSPTNGYHPLYLATVVPLFWLSRLFGAGLWVPIHCALTVSAACDAASGVVLYLTLVRAGLSQASKWALAIWFFSPFTVLLSLRGLEGSLNVLMIAVWLMQLSAVIERDAALLRIAVFGIVSGLAVLARTDNLLLLTIVFAIVAVARVARDRMTIKEASRAAGIVAITAGLILLPWLVWNVSVFGSPVQVSAAAKMANPRIYGHLGELHGLAGPVAMFLRILAPFWQPIVYVSGEEFSALRRTFVVGWLAAFVLVLAVPRLRREIRHGSGTSKTLILSALLMLLVHALLYGLVLKSYSTWYASAPSYLLSLITGAAVGALIEDSSTRARVAATGIGVAASLAIFAGFFTSTGVAPGGPEKVLRPVFRAISTRAQQPLTIGVFNAGRPGYFAPAFGRYRVVNLDCLVNNAAFKAWRNSDYSGYVLRTVDLLLVDDPSTLETWMSVAEVQGLLAHYPHLQGSGIYGPRRD